jgi:hypothetical protein
VGPDTVLDEVSWEKGQLTLSPKKVGLKQFSLRATSVFGVTQDESFLFEVLPWNWGSVLLLGDGPSEAEVRASGGFFDSVQVANPALQLNDPRLLVERKTAFVTTTAFDEPSVVASMEKLVAGVANIVVSTPSIDKLEGALKEEVAALGITYGSAVKDPATYALEVTPSGGLNAPTNPIRLTGKLNKAAESPLSLVITGTACKVHLVLKKAGEADIPVMAECKRSVNTKGVFVVSGIAFADIQVSPADKTIVKNWLSELVAQ